MTRKDFRVLADALGVAGKNMDDMTFMMTVDIVARALRCNYPNFDAVRFEAAANVWRTLGYCPGSLREA